MGCSAARSRGLDQNRLPGNPSLRRSTTLISVREKRRAGRIVTDICGSAFGPEAGAGELFDHGALTITRETQSRAQPPVIRCDRAQQSDQRGAEEPVACGELQEG